MRDSETVDIRRQGPRDSKKKTHAHTHTHSTAEFTKLVYYQTLMLAKARATQAAVLICHGGRSAVLL